MAQVPVEQCFVEPTSCAEEDTICAGIIRSLAPEVELVSVKVLGARLSGAGVHSGTAIDVIGRNARVE